MNLDNKLPPIKKYDMNIDSASETAALVKATGQFQLCVTFWVFFEVSCISIFICIYIYKYIIFELQIMISKTFTYMYVYLYFL